MDRQPAVQAVLMMRCDHCTADAVVVAPGAEPVRELFMLRRPIADRCWCLQHAQAAGFPWLRSEAAKRGAAA